MKLSRIIGLIVVSVMLFASCGKEEAIDITGEYVIYLEGEDIYDLHNKTAEIAQIDGEHTLKTFVIGDETGLEVALDNDEIPHEARFQHLALTVTWLLTPSDNGFNVIWRDNVNIEDVIFELRGLTDEEAARVAEEERIAADKAEKQAVTDVSELIIEADGVLDITVEELVDKVHAATEPDDFAEFSEVYKRKSTSATAKIESISMEIRYANLYKILAYRDFDNNSWNKNTLRLTLFTTDKELAFSYTEKESYEMPFVITKYEKDNKFYVVSIEGTLVRE